MVRCTGLQIPVADRVLPLEGRFPSMSAVALDFMKSCLVLEPSERLTCSQLLEHPYFSGFREWFEPELQAILSKDSHKEEKRRKSRKVSEYVRCECFLVISIPLLTILFQGEITNEFS